MRKSPLCTADYAVRIFSDFLIALHELGRLDEHELARWQEGVAQALNTPVPDGPPREESPPRRRTGRTTGPRRHRAEDRPARGNFC